MRKLWAGFNCENIFLSVSFAFQIAKIIITVILKDNDILIIEDYPLENICPYGNIKAQ